MKLYPDYNFDSVPVDNKIIISRDKDYDPPEGYTAVTSPESAVDLLKEKETETMYIIGGGKIVTYFVATGLADELHLTINPYILGKGRPFINSDSEINRKLELVESEQLEDGRLFVKYKIIK
jgi:dihydrofolate reductase